ncbi:heterokaryon incompatibility protein-domain-containing protein [Xylariaceae sp. FL1651]|nr:heterokaryon incompatibility protein-domain-containing protein [Xylariaceae sp. FL1651]
MRLLNVKTLKLEDFLSDRKRPKYAILSHTWLEEEVLFNHIETLELSALEKLKGFAKVKGSCARAQADGYNYIWIDTCCIDKSSSAELTEAINSMWSWYRQSDICYAFISDTKKGDKNSFRKSRWFKRGWTLQELIAPDKFKFYDQDWEDLGGRVTMAPILSEITGIDENVLSRNHQVGHTHDIQPGNLLCAVCGVPTSIDEILRNICVASKMSWSANRETTRGEDRSYSLLGLFGVNMSLLYGEGEAAAWVRLLNEVIRKTRDQSVLAFDYIPIKKYQNGKLLQISRGPAGGGIYAENAKRFATNIKLFSSRSSKTMGLVTGDLVLDIWLCPLVPKDANNSFLRSAYKDIYIGLLDCYTSGDSLAWPAIILKSITGAENKFTRKHGILLKIDMHEPPSLKTCRALKDAGTEDLIVRDMTYNLSKADLRRITIVDDESEIEFMTSLNSAIKPLQVMPVDQPNGLHYKLDSSYPKSQSGCIEKIPVFWSVQQQNIMGMAIFSDNNRLPFMVTWGPHRGEQAWCKLFTLSKVDSSNYESQKETLARTLRSKAWDDHKSLQLEYFNVNRKTVCDIDAVAFGNVYVSVKIQEVKALDREIWQLQIQIRLIGQNRGSEKND